MKHANKKGGEGEEKPYDDEEGKNDLGITSGGKTKKKRGNGHKANCKCPICKNMKKKSRKGGEEPDIENESDDLEEGGIKAQPIPKNTEYSDIEPKEVEASDDDYEKGESEQEIKVGWKKGGKSRKKRRGNGHKANCMCPICKNMRKGKKTRRH